jgi:hypothetical protein
MQQCWILPNWMAERSEVRRPHIGVATANRLFERLAGLVNNGTASQRCSGDPASGRDAVFSAFFAWFPLSSWRRTL